MGTKLPSTAASGDYAGDNVPTEAADLEKQAWQRDRAMQYNQTADLLWYEETGGNAVAGKQPTYTLKSGLTDLNVYVDDEPLQRIYRQAFGLAMVEDADAVFIFYDVPNMTLSGILQALVKHDSRIYKILNAKLEVESGRLEVLGKEIRGGIT